ncbi:nascent polypeptide-associated complex protein [Sulfolobus sp. S-194]|nr:nascent polypeptide-associated complex protein [Sulfolobus sp. S-194]
MKPKPNQFKNLERMLGVKTEQLDAVKVTIELKDKILVIENPTVIKMVAQGQEIYSVMGQAKEAQKEEPKVEIKDEDVKFVMEQTGKGEQEVREALQKANGDIAKAILLLTGQET